MLLAYHITHYLCNNLKDSSKKEIIFSCLKTIGHQLLEAEWRNTRSIRNNKPEIGIEFLSFTVKLYNNKTEKDKWITYHTKDLSDWNIFPKIAIIEALIKTLYRGMEAMTNSTKMWYRHSMFDVIKLFQQNSKNLEKLLHEYVVIPESEQSIDKNQSKSFCYEAENNVDRKQTISYCYLKVNKLGNLRPSGKAIRALSLNDDPSQSIDHYCNVKTVKNYMLQES